MMNDAGLDWGQAPERWCRVGRGREPLNGSRNSMRTEKEQSIFFLKQDSYVLNLLVTMHLTHWRKITLQDVF
jgi:hypothetical protein